MVLYVYRMFNCQRFQPIKINYGKQIVSCLVIAAMLVMCFMQMLVFDIINGVLGVAIFVWFNRDLIKKLYGKFKGIIRRKG